MKHQIDDQITIGLNQYTVLLAVDVEPNKIYLTQENVTQMLVVVDENEINYTVKVYDFGKYSSPQKMMSQK